MNIGTTTRFHSCCLDFVQRRIGSLIAKKLIYKITTRNQYTFYPCNISMNSAKIHLERVFSFKWTQHFSQAQQLTISGRKNRETCIPNSWLLRKYLLTLCNANGWHFDSHFGCLSMIFTPQPNKSNAHKLFFFTLVARFNLFRKIKIYSLFDNKNKIASLIFRR